MDKIIEELAMALTHSEQGSYEKNEEYAKEICERIRQIIIK